MSAIDPRDMKPDIDYLTRDYRGLRDFMLALRGKLDTAWTESSAADVGVTVLEALAYRLDHLAYAGDRVASEAFIGTARSRQAVRRHAALGDHLLDRGSTSSGYQHFALREGELELAAMTSVGTRLSPEATEDGRDIFQTTQALTLDQRRNSFHLRKSLPAGSSLVWLAGSGGQGLALWSLGFRPGMLIALVSRDHAEIAEISRVQSSALVLATPCQHTYHAGTSDRAASVLANIAPVRRGQLTGWRLLGTGGRDLEGGPRAHYFQQRVAMLAALAEELEQHRGLWAQHADLAHSWQSARRLMDLAVCRLRTTVAALSGDLANRLIELLDEAETLLRSIATSLDLALSAGYQRSKRVPLPRQALSLPQEDAVLFLEDTRTIEVVTLTSGQVTRWDEVEDFLRSGPNDRHYVVEIADIRRVAIRFGDGAHGAMPAPGAPILARWVTGDPALADVGRGALSRPLGPHTDLLECSNPTSTSGWRAPEELSKVPGRIRRELSLPATAITESDLVSLLERDQDVAEAAVVADKAGAVEASVRLRPSARALDVLPRLKSSLRGRRLIGTRIDLKLARPLFVNVTATVKVHPEAEPRETMNLCASNIIDFINEARTHQLGAPISRAELHRVIESTNGVMWGDVASFARTDRSQRRPAETIQPAYDQVLRSRNLPDNPASGKIELWSLVEFSLQVELLFIDPDERPDEQLIHGALLGALSGIPGVPHRDGWSDLSNDRLTSLLDDFCRESPHFRLRLRALIYRERSVELVLLQPFEVPVVVSLQIIPRRVGVLK